MVASKPGKQTLADATCWKADVQNTSNVNFAKSIILYARAALRCEYHAIVLTVAIRWFYINHDNSGLAKYEYVYAIVIIAAWK